MSYTNEVVEAEKIRKIQCQLENEKIQKIILPLEKVLTISAGDYCKMQGKELSDYVAVGVRLGINERKVVEFYINNLPNLGELEVIVDVHPYVSNCVRYVGTMLFPKKVNKKPEEAK